jgi:SAM-dependent methyltransferase
MKNGRWHKDNLRRLLIAQQEEYQRRQLEHQLYAETDEAFYSRWLHHRLTVLSLIPEECRGPRTKVLDVGGGKGRFSTLLSDLELDCVNIDCLFLDNDALNVEGKPLVPLVSSYNREKGVEIVARDVYEDGIPFPDDTFDLAIFSEVIEHLPNSPKPLLAEMYRVLRQGGWLILTTPNLVSFKKRILALYGWSTRSPIQSFYQMEGYPMGSVYRGHNREYTLKEIEYMLAQEKFTIESAQTTDFAPTKRSGTSLGEILDNTLKDQRRYHLRVRRALFKFGELVGKRLSSTMGDYITVRAHK